MNRPTAALTEYRYWSERMCAAFLSDTDSHGLHVTGGSLGMPLGPLAANVSLQKPTDTTSRALAARKIQNRLKRITRDVEDLAFGDTPLTLRGSSRLVLSSLRKSSGDDTGAVALFGEIHTRRKARIAVCLFGSATNVCDFAPTVPQWREFGWTSSHIEGVTNILMTAASAESAADPDKAWWPDGEPDEETIRRLCSYAVNLCEGQGEFFSRGTLPWRRGYTLGHFENAEWLARVYYGTRDSLSAAVTGFDAIYVGSAFWVRSPATSWVTYDKNRIPDLEASRYPAPLRPFARSWYRRQHPRGTKENRLATGLGMIPPMD